MSGLLPAQLEFSAEDEEVDIVPSFQVQDLVHDDMLTIAAVRLGRCPGAPGANSWFLEWEGANENLGIHKACNCVEAGDLRAVQAKPGNASAAMDGADAAQAEKVPHKPA